MCLLLAAVLAVAGCAARRPAGDSLQTGEPRPATASAPREASSCAAANAEQTQPETDGVDLALQVASAVVLAGVLVTAVVLGARGGGVALPPLHLEPIAAGCPVAGDGAPCPRGDPGCAAAATTTAPG